MAEIPLYGLLETEVTNDTEYENPFLVELNATFTRGAGSVEFFGFHDGDGRGAQQGNAWKLRFMPDEPGTWSYTYSFSDRSGSGSGSFVCTSEGARPGPWAQDPNNPHWFLTARGERFLPVAMHANCLHTPIDWQDAIAWCTAKGYNTLVAATMNGYSWGDGWGNRTAFATAAEEPEKKVDYDRMNIPMWTEWDQMIEAASEAGVYIGPFAGPAGYYGGQSFGQYPPTELAFFPEMRERFDTPRNRRLIRYLVARQGAYWNLAYWNLWSTELTRYKDPSEVVEYGEYFASITPFGRMITAQDIEQKQGDGSFTTCLSQMQFSSRRKLNTLQTAVGDWRDPYWQNAFPNNELASESYHGFPVMTTEGLWEGQPRGDQPLRIIWGFFAAGAHTMWADWRYEHPDRHEYGSIGRGWVPVKPLDRHQFKLDQLGVDTLGDEQLVHATTHMLTYAYWKMWPHNALVAGGAEAYCLAEPGRQYMIYAPEGGTVKLDLRAVTGAFTAQWFDPRTGTHQDAPLLEGGSVCASAAPDTRDWVLSVRRWV